MTKSWLGLAIEWKLEESLYFSCVVTLVSLLTFKIFNELDARKKLDSQIYYLALLIWSLIVGIVQEKIWIGFVLY